MLEGRLARLSRLQEYLIFCVVLCLTASILLSWAGCSILRRAGQRKGGTASVAGEVRASHFVVEDANGLSVGELGVVQGSPCLSLSDEGGKPRIVLSVMQNKEAQLTFLGSDGRPHVVLKVDEGQEPMLSLLDAKGVARAGLAISRNEEPGLFLFDEQGRPCATFSHQKHEGPGLVLWDETKGIAMLTVGDGGRLSLREGNGRERVLLHTDGKDVSGLWLRDKDERDISSIAATNAGPVLRLRDSQDKLIWSAP
ncbi:MAG: hypothetical protein ACM3VT_12965 [Solirubrobacterales bacterium]